VSAFSARFFPHTIAAQPLDDGATAMGGDAPAQASSPVTWPARVSRSQSRTNELVQGDPETEDVRSKEYFDVFTRSDVGLKALDSLVWNVDPADPTEDRTMTVIGPATEELPGKLWRTECFWVH
jgi:hypothetical protein